MHVIDGLERRIGAAWALVAEAIMRCEPATVYDNSGIKGLRIVAEMTQGFVVGSPRFVSGVCWLDTQLSFPRPVAPGSQNRIETGSRAAYRGESEAESIVNHQDSLRALESKTRI